LYTNVIYFNLVQHHLCPIRNMRGTSLGETLIFLMSHHPPIPASPNKSNHLIKSSIRSRTRIKNNKFPRANRSRNNHNIIEQRTKDIYITTIIIILLYKSSDFYPIAYYFSFHIFGIFSSNWAIIYLDGL